VRAAKPHDAYDMFLVPAADRAAFAAYGRYDLVERWVLDATATPTRVQAIATHHGSVTKLAFLDATDFVTAGADGRLVRWTAPDRAAAATAVPLAKIDPAIESFAIAPRTQDVVFADRDGTLWQVSTAASHAPATRLRERGPRAQRMIGQPDSEIIYAAFDNGDVLAIDTRDHHITPIFHAAGAIREIAITPDATTLAVSTTTGMLHIATRASATAAWVWQQHELHTVDHVLTADGLLVAAGNDSTVWIYSIAHDRWLCLPIGMDLRKIELAPTGDAAVSLDLEGRMVWIDLAAARRRLADDRGGG
jgi:hypothetical protein